MHLLAALQVWKIATAAVVVAAPAIKISLIKVAISGIVIFIFLQLTIWVRHAMLFRVDLDPLVMSYLGKNAITVAVKPIVAVAIAGFSS